MVGSGCGIYATKSVDRLFTEYSPDPTSRCAIGLVGLSGKVIVHTSGYRAQKASVIALVTAVDGVLRVIDDRHELGKVFQSPLEHVGLGTVVGTQVTSTQQWRSVIRDELAQRIPKGEAQWTWDEKNA